MEVNCSPAQTFVYWADELETANTRGLQPAGGTGLADGDVRSIKNEQQRLKSK